MNQDLTVGKPSRVLWQFCLPLFGSIIFQQLYNIVDALIIGRGEGVAALAAVSGSGWLDWAVLSVAMGMAQGFGIQIAQSFGAGNQKEVKRAAGQSILLSLVLILLLESVSQIFLHPILTALKFPEDTFFLTKLYLRIVFGAIPVIMGFNLLSGFLYGVGDSRTPLVALSCATTLNIVLDWVLVIYYHLAVAGAAAATVLSQVLSFIICLQAVMRLPDFQIARTDLHPDTGMMKRLLKLGTPIALQNFIISIGGLVLQRVVNGFGFLFMAGYNAASRLQGERWRQVPSPAQMIFKVEQPPHLVVVVGSVVHIVEQSFRQQGLLDVLQARGFLHLAGVAQLRSFVFLGREIGVEHVARADGKHA